MSKKNNLAPKWHPDFRIADELPDIKVVRTDFIVNIVAVAVLLFVLFLVGQQEYRAFSLKERIAKLQEESAATTVTNDRYLALNKRFRTATERVIELEKFYTAPIDPSAFLLEVNGLRPQDLIFESASYTESQPRDKKKQPTTYSFSVEGVVLSLGELSTFKNALQESSFGLSGYERAVQESTGAPDAASGSFPYKVSVQLEPAAKKPATKS